MNMAYTETVEQLLHTIKPHRIKLHGSRLCQSQAEGQPNFQYSNIRILRGLKMGFITARWNNGQYTVWTIMSVTPLHYAASADNNVTIP